MKATVIAGGPVNCLGGHCPTVYETDRGTYIIQGDQVNASLAAITLGNGEQAVEIPASLAKSLAAALNK